MANIIITESQLNILREYENNEIMYHQFESKMIDYLNSLLENPIHPRFHTFFSNNNIKEDILQNKLMDLGVLLKKKEGFNEPEDSNGKKHSVHFKQFSVKADKSAFNGKKLIGPGKDDGELSKGLHKLYDTFFSKNQPKKLNEEGEGGFAGGASSCGGLMVGSSDVSGGIAYPFGKVQRRGGHNSQRKRKDGDITKQESNVDMAPALSRNEGGKSISMNHKK